MNTNLPNSLITLKNITVSYENGPALRELSFTLRDGETLGMLGPNGAGKTTLIHLLLGIRSPDRGSIQTTWDSDPSMEKHRSHFGVVPQNPCFYEQLTGRENLTFFGQMYNLSGPELKDRVEDVLSMVNLSDRASDPVYSYSNGMKRRLSFAGALTHEPGVLLLDEPAAGVDPQSRHPLFHGLRTLQEKNRTVLYLTHNVHEAQKYCDRVGILDQGQLLTIDEVHRLIDQYGGRPVIEMTLLNPPEHADDLPGTLRNSTLRLQTERPGEVISNLQTQGLEFTECRIQQPDLETVFLNLTGRDIQDD